MKPVVAIIQARMTSTRLPGKVLADVGGKPMLARVLERVRAAKSLDATVVATTTNAADDPVAALAESLGVTSYRGDEMDVLGRYVGAAHAADAGTVIRLTADCPMIDPGVIDQAVAMFAQGHWQYVSNCMKRTYPDGLDTEVFSRALLEQVDASVSDAFLREHVTTYIRRVPGHPAGDFKTGDLVFEADFSHLHWTVDLPKDLALVRQYFARLPEDFHWLEAVALATREPAVLLA